MEGTIGMNTREQGKQTVCDAKESKGRRNFSIKGTANTDFSVSIMNISIRTYKTCRISLISCYSFGIP